MFIDNLVEWEEQVCGVDGEGREVEGNYLNFMFHSASRYMMTKTNNPQAALWHGYQDPKTSKRDYL